MYFDHIHPLPTVPKSTPSPVQTTLWSFVFIVSFCYCLHFNLSRPIYADQYSLKLWSSTGSGSTYQWFNSQRKLTLLLPAAYNCQQLLGYCMEQAFLATQPLRVGIWSASGSQRFYAHFCKHYKFIYAVALLCQEDPVSSQLLVTASGS